METVLILYCVEDTSKPAHPRSYFGNADLPKALSCRNAFVHYHSSTEQFPSTQHSVVHDTGPRATPIKHSLTRSGFDAFLSQATRLFPPSKYQHTLAIQSHSWLDRWTTTTTAPRATRTFLTTRQLVASLRRCFHDTRLKALIFDSCYMSTLDNIKRLHGSAHHMLACESASPYFGFISCARDLPLYVSQPAQEGLVSLVDDVVRYNENRHGADPSLLPYATDGAVLRLASAPAVLATIRASALTLRKRYDIDNYGLYDLHHCLSPEVDLSPLVVYYRSTTTMRRRYMHGIAVAGPSPAG